MNTLKLLEIIEHFGVREQVDKAKEELAELIVALSKKDMNSIAEEIADVSIMLEQLKVINFCEEIVDEIIEQKMERTMKIVRGEVNE